MSRGRRATLHSATPMRWSPTPSEANASAGEEDANSISNDVDAEWMKYCPICNKDIFASSKREVDERFEMHLRQAHPDFLDYNDDDNDDDDDNTTGFGFEQPREQNRGKDGTFYDDAHVKAICVRLGRRKKV